MRLGILAATAILAVTACTARQQGPIASVSSRVAETNGSVNAAYAQTAVVPWTAYRTLHFDTSTADVSTPDMSQVYEIVAYLKDNPSFDVGIDYAADAGRVGEADLTLDSRRAASVRRALMDAGAGVASYKIFTGAFADPNLRRAGQIQVFVGPRTGSLKVAP